jgi:mannosyltransferase
VGFFFTELENVRLNFKRTRIPLFRMTEKIALYKMPLLLLMVVLLGLTLRLYQIDRESLWFDEAHTYWTVRSSPADIVKSVANDVHAPLYFLFLHYWVRILGDSDGAMRLFSAMFGILAIPVVFQIGKLLFNDRFGLMAALFLSVSGFHIQYSQEARPYSFYFFLTSLSLLSAIIAHKGTRHAWIGYILSTVLLLYTHNTAILAVAAVMLFYLVLSWPWRPASLYPFLLANLAIVFLYTPWIWFFVGQAVRITERFWTSSLTAGHILRTLTEMALIPSGTDIPRKIHIVLLAVPFSILLLALPSLWAKEKKMLIALALLFLVPVGGNLLASTTIRNIFILRVLIPALLLLPFLWATPILMDSEGPKSPYRKLAVVAMASMFFILLIGSIDFLRHNSKEPWRQAVEIFQKSYKSGDVVVYIVPYNEIAFARYLSANFYNLPVVAIPAGSYLNLRPPHYQPINKGDKDETGIATLQALKGKNSRLWVILRHSPTTKKYKALIDSTFAWLDANYKNLTELKRKNLQFVLYEPL